MKNRYIILFIILILLAFVCIRLTNKTSRPLKIGLLASLSGDLSSLGDEANKSALLALNEINNKEEINGKKIESIIEDGKCSGKDATSAVKKLVEIDKVDIIFGGTCSSETLVAVPITEKSKTLLFTSWALNPKITIGTKYVFRNVPSDYEGAREVANLAYKNGVVRIGIITENTDYPLGFESIFIKEFKSLGGQVIINELLNPDTKDYKSAVSKVLSNQIDAVLLNVQGSNTGVIAKVIKNLGNTRPLYGNIYFADSNVLKNYGKYLEGGYTGEPANLDLSNPKVARFVTSYEKAYGSKPQYLFWASASYDAVNIYADAVKQVGYNTDDIRNYIHGLKSYEGVLGTYSFDENGDVVGIKFDDKQIIDSKLQVIK